MKEMAMVHGEMCARSGDFDPARFYSFVRSRGPITGGLIEIREDTTDFVSLDFHIFFLRLFDQVWREEELDKRIGYDLRLFLIFRGYFYIPVSSLTWFDEVWFKVFVLEARRNDRETFWLWFFFFFLDFIQLEEKIVFWRKSTRKNVEHRLI